MDIFGIHITSKEEKQKQLKAYKKKMYPLGDEQFNWETSIVDSIFEHEKDIDFIKYAVIYYREKIREVGEDEIDNFNHSDKKWSEMIRNLRISDNNVQIIKTIAELENKAKSLDELPTKEEILKASKERN